MALLMLIATVIASAAVIWQAFATAKSAKSAANAADAANKALALAEAESRISRGLLREAVRTRIDSGMPLVTVTARGVETVTTDTDIFRLPKDFASEIAVTLRFTLSNNSSRPVRVTQTGPYYAVPGEMGSLSKVHDLEATSSKWMEIAVSQKAGHWAAITEKLAADPSFRPEGVGTDGPFYEQRIVFQVVGELDTTARDELTLLLSGSPLSSVYQQEGAWTAADQELSDLERINSPIKEAPLSLRSSQVARTYFSSISRGEELE